MQRGVLQIEIVFRPDKNYDIFRLRCSRWEGCRANAVGTILRNMAVSSIFSHTTGNASSVVYAAKILFMPIIRALKGNIFNNN